MSMGRGSCHTMALWTGFAGFLLPAPCGLALVGDADARDLVGLDPALLHRAPDHPLRLLPDLHRVVLDPSGLGIDLLVLEVIGRHDLAIVAEHHETGPRGALVDGRRVLLIRHSILLTSSSFLLAGVPPPGCRSAPEASGRTRSRPGPGGQCCDRRGSWRVPSAL